MKESKTEIFEKLARERFVIFAGRGVYPYDGLANHNTNSLSSSNNKDLDNAQQKTATKTAKLPSDLQRIIESWDDLPQHIKNAIKTLLAASSSMA